MVGTCSLCTRGVTQRYRANTVVPCIVTAQLFVPVLMAIILFGQPGPRDGADAGIWSFALLLTITGIVWLARAPGVERALGAAPAASALTRSAAARSTEPGTGPPEHGSGADRR